MEYTKLGNSDLTVSRICMGCMGFGDPHTGQHSWTIDEEHSREVLQQALELGTRTLMMADGRIVLDVSGADRAGMTVEDLIHRFKAGTGKTLSNDRMLLS